MNRGNLKASFKVTSVTLLSKASLEVCKNEVT